MNDSISWSNGARTAGFESLTRAQDDAETASAREPVLMNWRRFMPLFDAASRPAAESFLGQDPFEQLVQPAQHGARVFQQTCRDAGVIENLLGHTGGQRAVLLPHGVEAR